MLRVAFIVAIGLGLMPTLALAQSRPASEIPTLAQSRPASEMQTQSREVMEALKMKIAVLEQTLDQMYLAVVKHNTAAAEAEQRMKWVLDNWVTGNVLPVP